MRIVVSLIQISIKPFHTTRQTARITKHLQIAAPSKTIKKTIRVESRFVRLKVERGKDKIYYCEGDE
jgi:hypothetical protein